MGSSGGGVWKNRDAAQPKQGDEREIKFSGYGMEEQDAIAWLQAGRAELRGDSCGCPLEFAECQHAVPGTVNVD